MTKRKRATEPANSLATVVYGLDGQQYPCAGQYADATAINREAALGAGWEVTELDATALKGLSATLPVGTIDAGGLPIVPKVDQQLYDQLMAADLTAKIERMQPPEGTAKRGDPGSTDGGATEPHPLWAGITVGNVVLASEDADDGWWPARVIAISGDELTLKWRDFPGYAPVKRSRREIGLTLPERA